MCNVQGLVVSYLSKTSDAYHDGLRTDDVIVEVDDEDVRKCSSSTVLRKLQAYTSSPVTVYVKRSSSVDESPENVSDSAATTVSDCRC